MTITVSSGVTSNVLRISRGDPLVVLSGGTAENLTILSGGSATLSSGGTALSVVVDGGGVLEGQGNLDGSDNSVVSGLISGVTLTAGYLELAAGGIASGVTVSGPSEEFFGPPLFVVGGAAFDTTVMSGDSIHVSGKTVGTIVESGGIEIIYSGGTASSDSVQYGGRLVVESGGTASDVSVQRGGAVAYGGDLTSDFTLVSGDVTSTTILGGITVSSGGRIGLGRATVLSGVTLSLASGTTAADLTVSSGGVLIGPGQLAGSTVPGALVAGSISGVLVGLYSFVELSAGGRAYDVTVSGDGASLRIGSGASATGTIVSGSYAGVAVSGAAVRTLIGSGGTDIISSGGVASWTTVESGGEEQVTSDGLADRTTVLSGGAEVVFRDGDTLGTTVSGRGSETVSSAGYAVRTEVLARGAIFVSSGGLANEITLSGGKAYVSSGAVADRTTISSGGMQGVDVGGVASGTTILSGGAEFMDGLAYGETVSSGGGETIYAGAAATGLTVLSGGVLIDDGEARIAGAGTLDGTLSGSGAIVDTGDLVLGGSGAAFSGTVAIEGGTVELTTSGAIGTGSVQFAPPSTGSAVLQIDAADAPVAGGTFANEIVNFSGAGEDIDLRSIAFVSGASATVGGATLVLTDGGKTYAFNVAGSSTAGAYRVLGDGHGGTLIDPDVAHFAQVAAAFAPSAPGKTTLSASKAPAAQTFLHAAASAGHG